MKNDYDSMFHPAVYIIGVWKSRVTKQSYKPELRIMTSFPELLNLDFYIFYFLELLTVIGKTEKNDSGL